MVKRWSSKLNRRLYLVLGICSLSVGILSGCSRGPEPPVMVPVTGKVLAAGKAVTAGAIYFHPDEANSFQKDIPSSLLQLDGSFTVKTYPFGEGVPPGKYKVTLSPELASRLKKPMYGQVAKTLWSIEVSDLGVNDHVFEVK
jgi:hypothetical protein